jgi:hypothetical protein
MDYHRLFTSLMGGFASLHAANAVMMFFGWGIYTKKTRMRERLWWTALPALASIMCVTYVIMYIMRNTAHNWHIAALAGFGELVMFSLLPSVIPSSMLTRNGVMFGRRSVLLFRLAFFVPAVLIDSLIVYWVTH